jgi:hypothetical protein
MNITLRRRWNISDAVTKRLKPVFFYKLLYEATLLNVMVTIQSQSQKSFGFSDVWRSTIRLVLNSYILCII